MWNARLLDVAAATTAVRVVDAREWLIGWARRLVPWWTVDGYDLLLTPIITQPPFPLGWMSPDRTAEEISQLLYHLQVLMIARDLSLDDVYKHL